MAPMSRHGRYKSGLKLVRCAKLRSELNMDIITYVEEKP